MPQDILHLVDIHPDSVLAWKAMCDLLVEYCYSRGIPLEAISEEKGMEGPDNSLLVYVDIEDAGRMYMMVPADHWRYRVGVREANGRPIRGEG